MFPEAFLLVVRPPGLLGSVLWWDQPFSENREATIRGRCLALVMTVANAGTGEDPRGLELVSAALTCLALLADRN